MSFKPEEFKQWLEIQGELNYVDNGFVVGFDYEWHLSPEIVNQIEKGEVIHLSHEYALLEQHYAKW